MKLGSVIVGTGLSENAYLVVEAAADLAQGRGRRCTLFVPATGYRTHQIRDTFAETPRRVPPDLRPGRRAASVVDVVVS
jgi:hypothetical protein